MSPRLGVIANPHSRRVRDAGLLALASKRVPDALITTERAADAPKAVRRLVDKGIDVIAVLGGDGTLSSVVTALIRGTDPEHRPVLAPLGAGSWNHVASASGVRGEPLDVLDTVIGKLANNGLKSFVQPTLRVSSSTRPGIDYGFNFYVGSLYDLVEDGHRRGSGRRHMIAALIAAIGRRLAERDRTMLQAVADERPLRSADTAWISVFGGRGGRLCLNLSPTRTLESVISTSQAIVRPVQARRRGAQLVERVVIDLVDGYVLDGDLYPSDQPYVCTVSAGPSVRLIRH